jgi:hypothetical protein
MVTITAEAASKIEQLTASEGSVDWFVTIRWRKGAADNRRSDDGAVAWTVEPDEGWVAELGGWDRGKVPPEEGAPLCGSVRLLVQQFFAPQPFAGGEIYLDGDQHLRVRAHAI